MKKEEILDRSRNSKEDERKVFVERQAYVNIVYTALFVYGLFYILKLITNKEWLDLDTVMVFSCPAWTAFIATKYYYNRKFIFLVLSIIFGCISILVFLNFFIDIIPLTIFR